MRLRPSKTVCFEALYKCSCLSQLWTLGSHKLNPEDLYSTREILLFPRLEGGGGGGGGAIFGVTLMYLVIKKVPIEIFNMTL